jgi:hypothetical protein
MTPRRQAVETTRRYSSEEIYEMSKLSPRRRALQSLARTAIVVGTRAFEDSAGRNPVNMYVRQGWDRDETFNMLLKGSVTPAMTNQPGWAEELAHVALAFLETLKPQSAGADLLRQCLTLSFDRANKIMLPAISPATAQFVKQGDPIPVSSLSSSSGPTMTPCKMASIITLTREMIASSNAESIVTQSLIDAAGPGLDAALFSNVAAVADLNPAGILVGVTPITASTNAIPSEAMADDLTALIAAVAAKSGNNNICFICSPKQAARIVLQAESVPWPILSSASLAAGTVIIVAINALVSALEPPLVDASPSGSFHSDTVPSTDPHMGPRYSTFQIDSVGLRLRMPVSWVVRDPAAVSYVTATKW